jgi:hypothetical protein
MARGSGLGLAFPQELSHLRRQGPQAVLHPGRLRHLVSGQKSPHLAGHLGTFLQQPLAQPGDALEQRLWIRRLDGARRKELVGHLVLRLPQLLGQALDNSRDGPRGRLAPWIADRWSDADSAPIIASGSVTNRPPRSWMRRRSMETWSAPETWRSGDGEVGHLTQEHRPHEQRVDQVVRRSVQRRTGLLGGTHSGCRTWMRLKKEPDPEPYDHDDHAHDDGRTGPLFAGPSHR